jgi:hypothetical protein
VARASKLALAVLVGVVGWDFFAATTFIGDDHLFLTFARHAPSPLAPFVTDQHGGEYYRPVPMAIWWLLGRLGGGELPFAVLAFALHLTVATLVVALSRPRSPDSHPLLAGALFLCAPATRAAALWFSASTDLLATAFTLAALLCLARGGRLYLASLGLAALAYLSKESALALPLLGFALLMLGQRAPVRRAALWTAPHLALAGVTLIVRFAVLGGWGGAGDERASAVGRAVQIGAGLAQGFLGDAPLPAPLVIGLGAVALGLGAWAAVARARAGERSALLPLVWLAIAALPLMAAGWVVGTRYFYLPLVGLAWLLAAPLARRRIAAGVAVAFLIVLGTLSAFDRRTQVLAYRTRVAAATACVASARAAGHRVLHVRSGIKDLDLVLKNQPALRGAGDLLVLADVPASFVLMPPALAERARFLLAAPPLPPSGAYHFGAATVAGLARRDESPTLDEVVERLPEIRFLELAVMRGGPISCRDVTGEKRGEPSPR